MASDKPQKGYLYTWNFFDGFLGLPKRKIHLKDTKPALLHVAYLGGGERWDNDETPSGALLFLILSASTHKLIICTTIKYVLFHRLCNKENKI